MFQNKLQSIVRLKISTIQKTVVSEVQKRFYKTRFVLDPIPKARRYLFSSQPCSVYTSLHSLASMM